MLLNFVLTLTIYCLLQLAHASASVDDDYDTIIESLRTEKLVHSGTAKVTKTKPCLQVSVNRVSVEKAIGRLSKKSVEVDPTNKFNLAYCGADESDEPTMCAVHSLCSTVYQWKKARTRSMLFGSHQIYVEDKVLLPTGCMCVLGQADKESGKYIPEPIIIL